MLFLQFHRSKCSKESKICFQENRLKSKITPLLLVLGMMISISSCDQFQENFSSSFPHNKSAITSDLPVVKLPPRRRVKPKLSAYKDYALNIRKSSLDEKQRFLLSMIKVQGPPLPFGESLASKVVYFERKASEVYLFEDLMGKMESSSLESKKFLSSFEIIEETEEAISFDFNKGMKDIFDQSNINTENKDKRKKLLIITILKMNINLSKKFFMWSKASLKVLIMNIPILMFANLLRPM